MNTKTIKRFGLIGFPLSHSFSAGYFTEKFRVLNLDDHEYNLYPLEQIDHVRLLFQTYQDFVGLNVTIPYKESIIPYLDNLDISAQEIGAVNCIKIQEGIKTGYNTDYIGFMQSIQNKIDVINKHAIVLGSGGASKAVTYALEQLGFTYLIISRNGGSGKLSYSELTSETIAMAGLIVNTTPLGMFPEIDKYPELPFDAMHKNQIVYDLIYNPAETLFLQKAKSKGSELMNGLAMLELQAEAGWEIWNDPNKD